MTIKLIPPPSTGSSTTTALYGNQHLISTATTVAAATGVVVPRYVEVSAGITLELSADADLEIS